MKHFSMWELHQRARKRAQRLGVLEPINQELPHTPRTKQDMREYREHAHEWLLIEQCRAFGF